MKRALLSLLLSLLLIATCSANPNPFKLSLNDRVVRSLVRITTTHLKEDGTPGSAYCTGFVVSASKGEALTAAHCVGDNLLVEGEKSAVLKVNEQLALLSMPPMSKPPLELRASRPQLSEEVRSFGFGYEMLMVLRRTIAGFSDGDLAVDGPLVPGMSGGPTVDMEGHVVGINQASSSAVGILCGADEIRDFLKNK